LQIFIRLGRVFAFLFLRELRADRFRQKLDRLVSDAQLREQNTLVRRYR